MNTGIISTRYATALLRYTQETGRGAEVCAQVVRILRDPDLLVGAPLEPELQRFVALLVQNGRISDVRLIFRTFVEMYYSSIGVKLARLVTCTPAPGLSERLKPLLEKQFDCKVVIEEDVDPSLVGGFRIEIGDYQLDASVRSRIEKIRRQFVVSNNRIV